MPGASGGGRDEDLRTVVAQAGNSAEVVLCRLRQQTKRDAVPLTIVAFENGQPVGSCSVIENDCVHRPQYAPWVAAVFVKPEWRHRGIASRLLQEACRVARRAGVRGLYIDCHVNTVPLYEQNGWTILEREVGDAASVVMLRKLEGQPAVWDCGFGPPSP